MKDPVEKFKEESRVELIEKEIEKGMENGDRWKPEGGEVKVRQPNQLDSKDDYSVDVYVFMFLFFWWKHSAILWLHTPPK
jgi:hypothetical protein